MKKFFALLLVLWALPAAAQPHRIVSLAPSLTEILFAVGAGNQVVGVSDYCNYPAAARKKPSIGGPNNLNTEKILALSPDLILSPEIGGGLLGRLERMTGAEVRMIETGRVSSIASNIREIGRLTGCSPKAERLASQLSTRLKALQRAPRGKKPRVFYLLWHDPLMTAGGGSYIDDLIRLAGGENIAGHLKSHYPMYGWESLSYEDPDVIFGPANLQKSLEGLKGKNLKAARRGKVYALDADLLSRPGPRVLEAVGMVQKILK